MEGWHLYKGEYRLNTLRWRKWDYERCGNYFITICAKDRMRYFGRIEEKKMILSDIGRKVQEIWEKIPVQFDHVVLGNFVVMPDHVHGMVTIGDGRNPGHGSCAINRAATPMQTATPMQKPPKPHPSNGGFVGEYNPMGKRGLGEIIRWFKGRVSYEIRSNIFGGEGLRWQNRYYDSIIWSEGAYMAVWRYIEENPEKWDENKGGFDY